MTSRPGHALPATLLALCTLASPAFGQATAPPATAEEPAGSWPFQLRARPLEGLPSAMAALMMSGQSAGQVLFSTLALPMGPATVAAPPPRTVVTVLLEIYGPSLFGEAGPPPAPSVEVYVYAQEKRSVRGFLSQEVRYDLESMGDLVLAGGVKLAAHLALAPGSYNLRVLVHEPSSGRFGLANVPLELAAETVPALSPLLAAEPPAHWLLVAETTPPRTARIDFADLFGRAGLPAPSALPVLVGEIVEADVLAYGTEAGGLPQSLRALWTNLEGGLAAETPVEVTAQAAAGLPGTHRLRLELPLGEVATGSYLLRLAGSVGGRDVTSPELPVVVLRRPAESDREAVWTDLQRRIGGDAPVPDGVGDRSAGRDPIELDVSGRRTVRSRRLQQSAATAFREILGRLALGEREGAVEDLLRIQAEVVEHTRTDPTNVVAAAELEVIEEVALEAPEALVPIAHMYHLAYLEAREARSFGLATHARNMAVTVAERYAQLGGEGADELASGVVAILGDLLQQAQVYTTARSYLQRALAIQPDNTYALLQLAAGLERSADYSGTVDLLRRAVQHDPKAPEARLRLAVNLLRLGRTSEGSTILDRLVREQNPDWVLGLAYETLAVQRLTAGDHAGAVNLLEQAVARLPGQGRLRLQLSYALERLGRRREAQDTIEGLRPVVAPSARHLYSQWPSGGREETEAALERAAMVRLGVLANALPAAAGGGR